MLVPLARVVPGDVEVLGPAAESAEIVRDQPQPEMPADGLEHLGQRAVGVLGDQLDDVHLVRNPPRDALHRPRRLLASAGHALHGLAEHRDREQQLGVLVVEDVDLAADLFDLVDVVPGPRLDQGAATIHRGAGRAGAQLVGALLERTQTYGRPQRLPAGQQGFLPGERSEEQRHPGDAELARDQLVGLDHVAARLCLVDQHDALACLPVRRTT